MVLNSKTGKVVIVLKLLMLTVHSCNTKDAALKENNNGKTTISKLPVDVVRAQETDINQEETMIGTIVPIQEVEIVSEVAQKIVRIAFKDGDNVSKGQLLYKLNDNDLRAKLKELQAELNLAILNEQRISQLFKMEAIKKQEFDDSKTKLQALEAQEEYLQFQLSKTEIRAPFSGRIGISKVSLGSYVTPGLNLVNLQDQSSVKINFSIPEKYLLSVKNGSNISFTTQLSDQSYVATIVASESGLLSSNRNLLVQAIAGNPNHIFKGGMSAKVNFSTSQQGTKGIKIPSEALIPGEKGYNVFIVVDGMAKLTAVTVGTRSESEATITSGIQQADTVIVSNILRLGDGMPVESIPSK